MGLAPPPPIDVPGGGERRRVLVLAQRGVAVDAVCARLRALDAWRASGGAGGALVRRSSRDGGQSTTYVWAAAAGGAGDAAVAARVRALAPAVLVLAFDVERVRSFDAILRWDAAVPPKLPRVWAAVTAASALPVSAGGGVSLRMTDVRDAAHCLGAPRTTVAVRLGAKMLGADADVRRLAAAVSRLIIASRPPRPPGVARPPAPERASPWSLIRQCL